MRSYAPLTDERSMQLSETKTKKSTIHALRELVQSDLDAIDALILDTLSSNVPLINTITQHIIKSGGKRLRPLLVILSARALNYSGDNEHHELAAIIECIHTATLLHDDVVDHSEKRRGRPTANALWGNPSSVLTGDFLYSRAFQLLAQRNNIPVMKVLANTTNDISEGEVLQLMNRHNAALTEADYLEVIRRKTAQLYAAAAEIGAIISTQERDTQRAMAAYGRHLGNAFQMVDDLLDYTADHATLGKNMGDDLAEGKMTLPLIYALQHGNTAQRTLITTAIQSGNLDAINDILTILKTTRACEYTLQRAKEEAERGQACLQTLKHSPYQHAMQGLLTFVLERTY
jgi:octaprenyl-diphosphate synthase